MAGAGDVPALASLPEDRSRVRELLGDRIAGGWMNLPTLVIKGVAK